MYDGCRSPVHGFKQAIGLSARADSSRPNLVGAMAMKRLGGNKAKELRPEQQNEIKQAFEVFDTDGSGSIDTKELKRGSWPS
eukprot:NODE_5182_length_605_cov_666.136364.p3 GENE.NODE_5182_length_605_cov_666.136364~~NODE_5182_length_605_cov_666.136364.p3  ORF type:complete len:82 (-),score=10.81 NODE_5182_length_605_cov_666.136364:177-422(-)